MIALFLSGIKAYKIRIYKKQSSEKGVREE